MPSPGLLQEGWAAQGLPVTGGWPLSSTLPHGQVAPWLFSPQFVPNVHQRPSFTHPSTRPVPHAGCRLRKGSPMRCREQASHVLSPRETRTNPSALAEPTETHTRAQPTQLPGTALSSSCCCLEARLRQPPAPLLPKSSPRD